MSMRLPRLKMSLSRVDLCMPVAVQTEEVRRGDPHGCELGKRMHTCKILTQDQHRPSGKGAAQASTSQHKPRSLLRTFLFWLAHAFRRFLSSVPLSIALGCPRRPLTRITLTLAYDSTSRERSSWRPFSEASAVFES